MSDSSHFKTKFAMTRRSVGGVPRAFGTVDERFMAKVYPDPMCGCWLWAGDSNGKYGSLAIYSNGTVRRVLAHRFSYERDGRVIPPGLELDHKCRVTHCVNPLHLEAVTPAVNRSRIPKGLLGSRRRDFCPKGHAYTEDNTRLVKRKRGPYKVCKTCERFWQKRYREKKRRAA